MNTPSTAAYRAGFMSKLAAFSKEAARFRMSMTPEELKKSDDYASRYYSSIESPYAIRDRTPESERAGWLKSTAYGVGNALTAAGAKTLQGAADFVGFPVMLANIALGTQGYDYGRGFLGRPLARFSRAMDRVYMNARLRNSRNQIINGPNRIADFLNTSAARYASFLPYLSPAAMARGIARRAAMLGLGAIPAVTMYVNKDPEARHNALDRRLLSIVKMYKDNPALAATMDPTAIPEYIRDAPTSEEVSARLLPPPEVYGDERSYGASPDRGYTTRQFDPNVIRKD